MNLRTLRAAFSVAALAPVALVGLGVQMVVLKFGLPRPWLIPMLFHRYGLAVIGVRRTVVGRPATERPLLMASNHASWLDICLLGAITPVSFVAKSEIADWPVFGTFARLQRSIFVDRARRSATGAVSRQIADRMTAGDAIVLFAEGTSGDGNRVLPFRSALVGATQAAMSSNGGAVASIQPVSIAYTHRNGLPLGRRGRPEVAWYGDLEFVPHLWSVLRNGAIDATITFGAPIRVDAVADRKALTKLVEREVRRMTGDALRGRAGTPADLGSQAVTPAAAAQATESRDRHPDEPEATAALS